MGGCVLVMAGAPVMGCGEQSGHETIQGKQQALQQQGEVMEPTAKSPGVVPLSVTEVIQAAMRDSDEADRDYQNVASRARAEGIGRKLQEEFETTAEEESSARQMMLIVLGDVGGDDEVPFLTSLAVEEPGMPDPSPAVSVGDGHDEELEEGEIYDHVSLYSERAMLRRAAVLAVARISEKGNVRAAKAMDQIIAEAADPAMAQSAALALHTQGRLTKAHRSVLKKRGIAHGFRALDTEKLMQLPQTADSTDLQPVKALTE